MQQQRMDGCDSALWAATEFHDMIAKLTGRLSVYRCQVVAHERPARFGSIVAAQLQTESERLRQGMTAIHQFTDVDASHRARISAKRLRYVVEPLSELADHGATIIGTLKSLQDAMGDLHDVHVFLPEVGAAEVKEAARPGLLRLARRLQDRGSRAYADLERHWLNDAGASFFERVRKQSVDIARRTSLRIEV